MREILAEDIVKTVADMCIRANVHIGTDLRDGFARFARLEKTPQAKEIFRQLEENSIVAAREGLPLCQDTGLAVFFVELGHDVRIVGLPLADAINEGVRQGYENGFLRKSACDPFTRKNTGDNTPAVIHTEIVPGDKLSIAYMAKGGGSENMSRVTMLAPAQGWPGVKDFVVRRVAESGPNPCPPLVVGVGIGGTFEYSAILAKKALLRELDDTNPDPDLAAKEAELLAAINKLGIGPMGLGGETTAMAVKLAVSPCHIASLPVAVNIQCHSSRHAKAVL